MIAGGIVLIVLSALVAAGLLLLAAIADAWNR